MANERRKKDRIDTHDMGLRAINRIDDEPFGLIGNLSAGGMMLITPRELYPGGVLQLMVEAPGIEEITPISLGVKILWCSPANSTNSYWVGLETIDISTDGLRELEKLLDYINAPVN